MRVRTEFGYGVVYALLKFAAVFCAGYHAGKVKRNYALVPEQFRYFAGGYLLRKAFYYGAFTYARVAYQHGVILCAAGKYLYNALYFLFAPYERVKLSVPRKAGKVAPVLIQYRRAAAFVGNASALRALFALAGKESPKRCYIRAKVFKYPYGDGITLTEYCKQYMLG